MISVVSAGLCINAAPAPCLTTFRSGHPVLMSDSVKVQLANEFSSPETVSGLRPNPCATTGRSDAWCLRPTNNRLRPDYHKPSQVINSVNNRVRPPIFSDHLAKCSIRNTRHRSNVNNGFGVASQNAFRFTLTAST